MDQGDLFLPSPGIPQSSSVETRRVGLRAARLTRDNLYRRMLAIYAQGPRTDWEMAQALGVERTTINARRKELIDLKRVKDTHQTRRNPKSGKPNELWGLA